MQTSEHIAERVKQGELDCQLSFPGMSSGLKDIVVLARLAVEASRPPKQRAVDKWKAQSEGIDWQSLVVSISRDEILPAVDDLLWQAFRCYLKGMDMQERFNELSAWLVIHKNSRVAQVQVANYVTALKRGGMWR